MLRCELVLLQHIHFKYFKSLSIFIFEKLRFYVLNAKEMIEHKINFARLQPIESSFCSI